MSKAIEIVWPSTTHRLCVSHMYQNAAKHLSHVFNGLKYFERDFSFCVYDCEDEKEFLGAWDDMLKKYDLYGNTWLKDLFENRTKWALVYGSQVFCADTKSTQRSESMNSVIKRYLDPKQRLLEFFNHYKSLLEERRHAELISDFYANQGHRAYKYATEFAKQFMFNIEAILLEESAGHILNTGTRVEDKEQCKKVSPHTAKSKVSLKVPKGTIKNDRGRGRKRFKGGLEENNKKSNKKNKVAEHTSKQCMSLESQNNKSLIMELSRSLTTPPFYFTASSIFGSASELLNIVESLSDVNQGIQVG